MAKYTAYIAERSQHSRGGSGQRYGGPDMYVAVQVVPEGAQPLKQLNYDIAERRGIIIIHCGEGYGDHRGPYSALGGALAQAESLADMVRDDPSLTGAAAWMRTPNPIIPDCMEVAE